MKTSIIKRHYFNRYKRIKKENLLGWFIILFALSLFALLIGTLRTEEKQGRLIKPFPKDTATNRHPECGMCRAVHEYSLNVNNHHNGDK